MSTIYDVTTWSVPGSPGLTAYTDIGAVINSIIADIKAHQPDRTSRPGAVIYIPPGDYVLRTRATVDISYLQIKGSGHGFTSSSIRYNTPDTSAWQELNPGGSHVRVQNTDGNTEAFLVSRGGAPRLSSIEFRDFCIDGVSFTPTQNSYTNGRVGIRVATDNDSLRVEGMGFVYLEHALVVRGADALNVTDNFIAECGNCVELTAAGQACKVTNNLIGAGPVGYSIFAEGHEGLLVTQNNVFPRGRSIVHLRNTNRSSVTANRFHGFYPGMVDMDGTNKENLVSGNHFHRQAETFGPFQGVGNGHDDLYGVVRVAGDNNMITTNLFVVSLAPAEVRPPGAVPAAIRVASGDANVLSNNWFVGGLPLHTVVLDASTTRTKVLDSGTRDQVSTGTTDYVLRPTP